ncbi:MAG: hypothetical protein ACLT1K_07290 [[Clostridium] leptum]
MAENSRAIQSFWTRSAGAAVEYRRIFTKPSRAAELAGDEAKDGVIIRAESPRLAACRDLCAGRHGGAILPPVLMNANPGENRRGGGIDNGDYAAGKDGRPNPDIMAAASIAGVDRVFPGGRGAGGRRPWLTAPSGCPR